MRKIQDTNVNGNIGRVGIEDRPNRTSNSVKLEVASN